MSFRSEFKLGSICIKTFSHAPFPYATVVNAASMQSVELV